MELNNMTPQELAEKTYRDLQKRKRIRRKAACECESLKVEAVIKANKKNYRIRNR